MGISSDCFSVCSYAPKIKMSTLFNVPRLPERQRPNLPLQEVQRVLHFIVVRAARSALLCSKGCLEASWPDHKMGCDSAVEREAEVD